MNIELITTSINGVKHGGNWVLIAFFLFMWVLTFLLWQIEHYRRKRLVKRFAQSGLYEPFNKNMLIKSKMEVKNNGKPKIVKGRSNGY